MSRILIKQVDAFTTQPFCGNPAGVIVRADEIPVELMQRVAGELNTLESTFVTRIDSPEARHRIRFFTPEFEYNFSGHAMLATCYALAEEGMVPLGHGTTRALFRTNIGDIPVDYYLDAECDLPLRRDEQTRAALAVGGRTIGVLERVMISRTINELRQVEVPSAELAKILGVPDAEIRATGLPVEVAFSGISQLIVPVRRRATLVSMRPDLIRLRLLNEKLGVLTTDVFTLESINPSCITYSRHFSPAMGMWEDEGSGAGAASIATYLVSHGIASGGLMTMEQGSCLDRLSRVLVDVGEREGDAIPVRFGGLAVTSITRTLEIEADRITVT